MKQNLLWISALLLILAGCSSDDEITTNDNTILGYWEYINPIDSRGGLLFTSDGEIERFMFIIYHKIN